MKILYIVIVLSLWATNSWAQSQDTTALTEPYTPYNHSENTVLQRFNPIFGNEKQSNEIISFIASNLAVQLPKSVVEKLNGYMGLQFAIDSTGNFGKFAIIKSYNTWVDYAIIDAMSKLPRWGTPIVNKEGEVIEKNHRIFFTFGTYNQSDTYGFQGDAVDRNTQAHINEQRNALAAEIARKNRYWDAFTKDNATLEYDIKDGLKQEASVIEHNPLEPINDDNSSPTISITFRD